MFASGLLAGTHEARVYFDGSSCAKISVGSGGCSRFQSGQPGEQIRAADQTARARLLGRFRASRGCRGCRDQHRRPAQRRRLRFLEAPGDRDRAGLRRAASPDGHRGPAGSPRRADLDARPRGRDRLLRPAAPAAPAGLLHLRVASPDRGPRHQRHHPRHEGRAAGGNAGAARGRREEAARPDGRARAGRRLLSPRPPAGGGGAPGGVPGAGPVRRRVPRHLDRAAPRRDRRDRRAARFGQERAGQRHRRRAPAKRRNRDAGRLAVIAPEHQALRATGPGIPPSAWSRGSSPGSASR